MKALQQSERKMLEKIEKLNEEIEFIREDREKMKSLMNEAINKSSELLNEKNSLEKELIIKTNKIESLKNANLLLHKNMAGSYKSTDKNDKINKTDLMK